MNAKKRRLGKGLDALIGQSLTNKPASVEERSQVNDKEIGDEFIDNSSAGEVQESSEVNQADGERVVEVDIDLLGEGRYQPRMKMDEESLNQLADSIRAQGVLQPILARRSEAEPGRYEILAGHRRTKAAAIAGMVTVPVIIREVPDQAALAVALIENIQREDLNPIEEAKGIHRLIDEFELTHQQIGEYIGRSRSQVSNLLRLLNLSLKAREYLEEGLIDMGHARALLSLELNRQDEAAMVIVEKSLSVRETEKYIKTLLNEDGVVSASSKKNQKDADVMKLERDISEKLAAKVEINHTNKKGKVIIHYHGLDELDGILSKIH